MGFRCTPENRKTLEKLVNAGKANDLSEAIRYCIERIDKCTKKEIPA